VTGNTTGQNLHQTTVRQQQQQYLINQGFNILKTQIFSSPLDSVLYSTDQKVFSAIKIGNG
jgi:hypothetical protein